MLGAMPPGCFLSKLFYTIFSPFLPPLPSHRHCAPLHNHHHHHYHQFHRRHFLFTFTTTFFVSRFLIKAILATLFLISIPDIRFLFFPTLPTSSLFFCEAHLLPPHSNGGTIVNGSFALPPPLLPFSPLTPSVIISSQAAKAIDDKPIADFESLLQRIDSISRRQLCTPTLLSTAYNVPLVVQQPIATPVRQQGPLMMHLPITLANPPLPPSPSSSSVSSSSSSTLPKSAVLVPPVTSFHHHQTVSIPVLRGGWLSTFLTTAFTDDERCRRTAKVIDLLANVLAAYDPNTDNYRLLLETVQRTAAIEDSIYRLSIGWTIPVENTGEKVSKPLESGSSSRLRFHHCTPVRRKGLGLSSSSSKNPSVCDPVVITEEELLLATKQPPNDDAWLSKRLAAILRKERHYMVKQTETTMSEETTEWSSIFYDCDEERWFIAYRALILEPVENLPTGDDDDGVVSEDDDTNKDLERGLKTWYRVKGVISAHVDVTGTDINQCEDFTSEMEMQPEIVTYEHFENVNNRSSRFKRDNFHQQVPTSSYKLESLEQNKVEDQLQVESSSLESSIISPVVESEKKTSSSWIVLHLYGTNKCHRENSKCEFKPGHGMFRGGYSCSCKDGFHSVVANLEPTFNGTDVEQSFEEKNPSYEFMFACKRCAPGCDVCRDDSPCLSTYDWGFRISLLTITVLCIGFVFVLGVNIYRYRRLKVIKVASPIFLCITLLGCAIMYCETVTIFPVLDAATCVLTKWTRNFGFCITYSALLLKTWRVSLTYRVKSAHKIKLTDKQLLQWLFPILLVMAIYLAAWTISDTPQAVYIVDWNELKFKQCDYNWWDHSLLIGEFFFLLWGIKVCYNVRNAESLFNEARYITYAIYNITIVNMVMILIHLSIVPNSGPDIKFFFGFLRTQLSTTTTVILIFGPKFYRIIKGQGDLWDTQIRARGIAASFSNGGVGNYEETTDLYQENEELKEEIQKLAAQLEIMKICQMQFKNRHLERTKRYQQETAKL